MTGGGETKGRVEAVHGRGLGKSVAWSGHDGADVPAVAAMTGLWAVAAPFQKEAK